MKKHINLFYYFLIPIIGFSQGPRTAKEAFHQMKDNEAIILDVREKWEIQNTGMAVGARWISYFLRFGLRNMNGRFFLKTYEKSKTVLCLFKKWWKSCAGSKKTS